MEMDPPREARQKNGLMDLSAILENRGLYKSCIVPQRCFRDPNLFSFAAIHLRPGQVLAYDAPLSIPVFTPPSSYPNTHILLCCSQPD